MQLAASFRDLKVYQEARAVASRIFELSMAFPKEEIYALTDQTRRSSRSVGANIAEAWAKRRYEAHFVSKLTDANGEQMETQHWIDVAFDCGYVDEQIRKDLVNRCERIGGMLGSMMAKAEQFKVKIKVLELF